MSSNKQRQDLKELLALIASSGENLLQQWEQKPTQVAMQPALPSKDEYKQINTLLGAGTMLVATLQDPQERLKSMATQFYESRALHYVAKENVAEHLAAAGDKGLDKVQLAEKLNTDVGKLSRLMRSLATVHIFDEIAPDRWTVNRMSSALVNNKELRASIYGIGLVFYPLGQELLEHWSDPVKSRSYDPRDAVFCDLHNGKMLFEWLAERNDKGEPRMELELFHLAMVGGSRTSMAGVLADYPWQALGQATIVDIGGGIGGTCMALANAFPELRFVLQDRGEVLAQARYVWNTQHQQHKQRIEFNEHDFFTPQPIHDADIYLMRFIIHDWSQEKAVEILRILKPTLEKNRNARLLVIEHLIIPAHGSTLLPADWCAPKPLPANYGEPARTLHGLDMTVTSNLNSYERTPEEFKALMEAAGLRVKKFWQCRSPLTVIEVTS